MSAPATTDEPLIPLPEQRLARLALRRLSKPVARGKGRLLYLVGPAGCGKSALLTEFFRDWPASQASPLRLTASDFAAQLADASEKKQVPEFQDRFRDVSVFVCEDIQSLAGRPQTQQQLLAIIDDLLAHGRDVIVCSTKLPGQLEQFPAKLLNRFRGGTTITINPPAADSRAELLRLFVRKHRQSMTREALALLADSLEVSPRELAGIVTQLFAAHPSLKRADIDEFLRNAIPAKSISPTVVARSVAREFGLPLSALRSSRRSRSLVLPRQCAMWLCRKLCHASYPEIGDLFLRRHSSVIHAVHAFEARLDQEPALRQRLAKLEAACR